MTAGIGDLIIGLAMWLVPIGALAFSWLSEIRRARPASRRRFWVTRDTDRRW